MRILGFPKATSAYTMQFYRAVEALGVPVEEGDWSGRAFLHKVRRGDVVHINWPSFYYSTSGTRVQRANSILRYLSFLLIARAKGARIAWTAHNLYPHDGSRELIHRVARLITTRLASVVVTHGDIARARVAAEFLIPDRKLLTIHHGHWFDLFPRTMSAGDARTRLGIAQGDFVFGSIGLCKPYKGLEQLISAVATMPDRVVLLIAGKFQSEAYRAQIEARLEALAPRKVIFAPRFVPDDEMQHYALACDALVFPYSDILTSGSVMTAFTFGRPVIVPDKGSLREAVPRFAGIVYPPDEPEALSRAMAAAVGTKFSAADIEAHARGLGWDLPARRFIERLNLH